MARLGRAQPKRAFVTRAAVEVEAALEIIPAGPTVTATPGTVTITPGAVNITPAAVTVTATAGSLSISLNVVPGAVTVTATPGTLTISQHVTPAAVTVAATPGSVTVVTAQAISPAAVTVAVTAGTVTIAPDQPVSPGAVTVTATPGSLTVAQVLGPVRIFDGTDDFIQFDPGAYAGWDGTEAWSVAILWKPDSAHAGWLLWADTEVVRVNPYSDGFLWFTAGGDVEQTVAYTPAEWQLAIFTKPGGGGAETVRVHVYDYGSETWSHTDEGTVGSSAQTAATFLRVGRNNTTEYLDAKLAAIAIWADSSPWALGSGGDATIEATGLETALQAWADADPDILWRFNQSTVADDVLDLTGGGADEVSITGTTVDTTDAPPDFDFTLFEGIGPDPVTVTVTPGSLRIDQNITLAGTVGVTPGAVTVVAGNDLLPAPTTVAVTPGALAVSVQEFPTYKQFVVNRAAHRESVRRRRQPSTSFTDFGPPLLAEEGAIIPAVVVVTATPGSLTVVTAQAVTPAAVTVIVAAGTLAVAAAQAITLAGPSVTATPGIVRVGPDVTMTAPALTVTPGALTLTLGPAIAPSVTLVNVTPGTLSLEGGVPVFTVGFGTVGEIILVTSGTASEPVPVSTGESGMAEAGSGVTGIFGG